MDRRDLLNKLGKVKYAKLVVYMQEMVLDYIVENEVNYDRMCMELDVDNLQEVAKNIIGPPDEIDYTALEEAYNVVLLYTKAADIDTGMDDYIEGGRTR